MQLKQQGRFTNRLKYGAFVNTPYNGPFAIKVKQYIYKFIIIALFNTYTNVGQGLAPAVIKTIYLLISKSH